MQKKEAGQYDQQGFSPKAVAQTQKFIQAESDKQSQQYSYDNIINHAVIEKITGALLRRN